MIIGGVEVEPGQRKSLELPVARLPTGDAMTMPLRVLRGRKSGPTLFVSAAVHGDEVNGVEILRRLLRHRRIRNLRGTLIAVPAVNVFGFVSRSRYLPDRRDLNRSFPGSETGSLASRLANLFVTEVVAHSTHGIDLHTASHHRTNLPQVRVTSGQNEALPLARRFGAPVVLKSPERDGSMRATLYRRDVPILVYEGGEALRFDEWAIRVGLRGILRVMESLEMIRTPKRKREQPPPLEATSSTWVRAPSTGVLLPRLHLGATVEKGERLGYVADPLGESEHEVLSPARGIVIGRTLLPLVSEGDALFHVARLDDASDGDGTLEEFGIDLEQPFTYDPEDQAT